MRALVMTDREYEAVVIALARCVDEKEGLGQLTPEEIARLHEKLVEQKF